ncbi:MAG: hypothetical protein SGPRY_012736 [Prymnesium sp.]
MRHGLGVRRGLCSASERVRVLIVGGGPVGLYASSLLSSYGVPSLLIDKQAAPSPHPRAHMINARSMELLRQLGVEDEVRSLTPPLSEWSHFVYTSSLHSAPIASQDHTATPEWRRLLSCSSSLPAHLSQPKLEAVLRAEAARRGGRMLDSTPLLSLKPHATGVQAVLGGEGGGRGVEADHVLACDGAHSHVRSLLGLELRGPPTLVRFSSVHFSCPPLEVPPAMLYFVFNPSAVAVLVAHNIQQGEWVAQIPFFGREPSEAQCKAQLEACVGEGVPLTLHSCSAWGMKAKSSAPGCRLPHHWLRAAGGEVLSTHDALHSTSAPFTMPNGRPPTLMLLVDAQERSTWKHALLASRAKYVSLVAVGRELSEGDSSVLCDEEGGWEEKRGVEPSGALLVRPDGHVAWRCRSLQPPRKTHAAEALAAALHALKWS